MNPSEIVQLVEAILNALAPIGVAMVNKALEGGDPLDALAKEHVAAILPAPLRLELAMAAERAKLAMAKAAAEAHVAPGAIEAAGKL